MTPHFPHPAPGHPHHPGPEWIVAVHEDALARSTFAAHLAAVADAAARGPELEVGGTVISIPAELAFDLRYERTPHGSLALVIRAEWHAENGRGNAPLSAQGLVIRSAATIIHEEQK